MLINKTYKYLIGNLILASNELNKSKTFKLSRNKKV